MVFAHDLNWSGRPIPQSYSVYTASLDKKNTEHLRSQKAADTILFNLSPIDNRLPSIEDAGSILELLARYTVSDFKPPYVILKRHEYTPAAALDIDHKIVSREKFGQSIALETTRPLWVQADIRSTLLGKFVSLLFKLPLLNIELTLDDGQVIERRIIPDVSTSGFLVSPYIYDAQGLIALAAGVDFNRKVKSIKFISSRWGFWREEIDLTVIPIDIVPQQDAKNFLFASPVEKMPVLDNRDNIHRAARCTLDRVNGEPYQGPRNPRRIYSRNGFIHLRGWTMPNRESDDNLPIEAYFVVLSADKEELVFKANAVNRPDLARHFNRPGLVDSAYDIRLDLSGLEGEKIIRIKSVSGDVSYDCPFSLIVEDMH